MKPIFTIVRHFLFIITIALFVQCNNFSNQDKQKEAATENNLQANDKNSIFDGETLNGWEITQFGTQGPIFVSDGKVMLDYGDGCTGITSTRDVPKINYEVILDARRTSGNDFFCGITFPVNDQFCSLIIGGWGGSVIGLSNIDGKDAANNKTNVSKHFDNDTWYTIKLKVSPSKIETWIDGEKMIDYTYKEDELSLRSEVNLSKPLGICSWKTSAELRNIKLTKVETPFN